MGMGFAPTWLCQVSPLLHMTTLAVYKYRLRVFKYLTSGQKTGWAGAERWADIPENDWELGAKRGAGGARSGKQRMSQNSAERQIGRSRSAQMFWLVQQLHRWSLLIVIFFLSILIFKLNLQWNVGFSTSIEMYVDRENNLVFNSVHSSLSWVHLLMGIPCVLYLSTVSVSEYFYVHDQNTFNSFLLLTCSYVKKVFI